MEQWTEPARAVPVVARPDVLVVGAGAAGIAAAIASARRGADTCLLEGSGFIGGLATAGLINLLLTLDDGAGTQVVSGFCQEMVDRLDSRALAIYPPAEEWDSEDPVLVDRWRRWGLVWGAPPSVRYSVAFDPEDFVDAALDALGEAGVRLRFHTWFAGTAVHDGAIEAVFVESKNGREAFCPRVVVDATGDGDVFVSAGAQHERMLVPPYLWFRVGGVEDVERATDGLVFRTNGRGRVLVPWGPDAERVDACDPDSMTKAALACRRAARSWFDSLRQSQPEFAGAWIDDYARMLGITESRRLIGDYVLAKEDGDRHFEDTVARTGHWTRRGVVYEIPLRCLTTAAVSNLLAAGRCISTTRYVHQATKEIPAAMATGEAAGAAAASAVAAAASSKASVSVHHLDVAALRAELRAAGADVG